MCEQFISEPTVVEPSGRAADTAVMAACSISATMAGVANTGRSPEPIVRAVFSSTTVVREVADKPFSNILFVVFLRLIVIFVDKDSEKMRKWLFALLILLIGSSEAVGQRRRMPGVLYQEWLVERGDSIAHIESLPVYVFSRPIDLRRYRRLVTAVKRVYPLAQIAKHKLREMEGELLTLDKKEQRAYIKKCYKEILDEYTPVAKRMTRTQGMVFIKLIDRETNYTAYQLIREFRGGFVASFWQGIGRIFGHNLKTEYDRENIDKVLEQIVIYYEAGLL